MCTFLYNLFCPSLYRLVLSYPQRVRRPLTYGLIFVQRIFSFFLSIILICAYHIKEGNTRHLSDQQASTERLTLVGFPIPFPCHYRHYKCLHLSVFPYDDQFPETSYDNRGSAARQVAQSPSWSSDKTVPELSKYWKIWSGHRTLSFSHKTEPIKKNLKFLFVKLKIPLSYWFWYLVTTTGVGLWIFVRV